MFALVLWFLVESLGVSTIWTQHLLHWLGTFRLSGSLTWRVSQRLGKCLVSLCIVYILFLLSFLKRPWGVYISNREWLRADSLEGHSPRSQEDVSDSRVDEVSTCHLVEFLVETENSTISCFPLNGSFSSWSMILWICDFEYLDSFCFQSWGGYFAPVYSVSCVLFGLYLYCTVTDTMEQTVSHLTLLLTHFKEVRSKAT